MVGYWAVQHDSLFYFAVKKPFSFPRSYRLKSPVAISRLFEGGKGEFVFPVRITYRYTDSKDDTIPFKAAVSVPKKFFKKAVDRNRLKRHLREAIRLQQALIPHRTGQCLHFIVIYIANDLLPGQQIHAAVRSLFEKLAKHG